MVGAGTATAASKGLASTGSASKLCHVSRILFSFLGSWGSVVGLGLQQLWVSALACEILVGQGVSLKGGANLCVRSPQKLPGNRISAPSSLVYNQIKLTLNRTTSSEVLAWWPRLMPV